MAWIQTSKGDLVNSAQISEIIIENVYGNEYGIVAYANAEHSGTVIIDGIVSKEKAADLNNWLMRIMDSASCITNLEIKYRLTH